MTEVRSETKDRQTREAAIDRKRSKVNERKGPLFGWLLSAKLISAIIKRGASYGGTKTKRVRRVHRLRLKLCGGDLTFKGTRVLVKDVLYYVAKGKDWDLIVSGYHGISREAIAEAISLASNALIVKVETRRRAA